MNMNKKVRWGVIGAGGIADRRTIPGILLCQNAELTAVMEVNMELAEKSRAKWGCAKAYDNEADLLADPEVDAVYIASPVALHARQAMAAADVGKHVLVEKPLAMTAKEAREVVAYCESRGVKIAAGFMMRFGSYIQAMKRAIAEGKIGRPVSGYAQFTCWYPYMPGAWRQNKAASGGGAMMDMGVHCIDLMQYILDTSVKEVAAFHDTLSFRYEVEDTSTVLLRMENGCQCVVQSNFNIPSEVSKWRVEVFGDRGRLVGDGVIGQVDGGTRDAVFLDDAGGYVAMQDVAQGQSENISVTFGNTYQREIESFSHSLLTGADLECPASQAAQVQAVMEAAYISNDEGRTVKL